MWLDNSVLQSQTVSAVSLSSKHLPPFGFVEQKRMRRMQTDNLTPH